MMKTGLPNQRKSLGGASYQRGVHRFKRWFFYGNQRRRAQTNGRLSTGQALFAQSVAIPS